MRNGFCKTRSHVGVLTPRFDFPRMSLSSHHPLTTPCPDHLCGGTRRAVSGFRERIERIEPSTPGGFRSIRSKHPLTAPCPNHLSSYFIVLASHIPPPFTRPAAWPAPGRCHFPRWRRSVASHIAATTPTPARTSPVRRRTGPGARGHCPGIRAGGQP
jgi:hypothetical protein